MSIMLRDFMESEIYQIADIIELLDKDWNEIDIDPEWLKNTQILDYYVSEEQSGLLTIILNM